ncbi:hypothetical protein Bbelb_226340 [Branchiostoma belcheri]|nr:hypothetical protein Bbelb_226340 [Branchiostoma belcheri]
MNGFKTVAEVTALMALSARSHGALSNFRQSRLYRWSSHVNTLRTRCLVPGVSWKSENEDVPTCDPGSAAVHVKFTSRDRQMFPPCNLPQGDGRNTHMHG